MKYKPDIVLHHFPCSDGITAAAVVFDYYGQETSDEEIEFRRADYKDRTDPAELARQFRGKHVLLVDFSFKKETLDIIQQTCESLLILDHHKTAQAALRDFEWVDNDEGGEDDDQELNVETIGDLLANTQKTIAIFDMKESGASLAWKFFNPNSEVPLFIQHIADIDLGKNQMENAKEFQWYSRSLSFVPSEIAELLRMDQAELESHFNDGAAIWKFVSERLTILRETSTKQGVIGGVPFAFNITDYALANALGNTYLEENGYKLAIIGYFTGEGMGFSLRSEAPLDCSEIAKQFGGGGHAQAAGFNIPWDQLEDFLDATIGEGVLSLEATEEEEDGGSETDS